MGLIDHISDVFSVSRRRKRKRKVMQTVEIMVKMDCDGCERRVTNAVSSIKGVKTWDVDRKHSKVTAEGYLDPNKVLKEVQSTGKRAAFWPYIEHELVDYPYARKVYDKKAPPGFVRDVDEAYRTSNDPIERYYEIFNDENVDACSVM